MVHATAAPLAAPPRAGLLRRLAALFYDGLLLTAVLFVATALVLPLTGGEAVGAQNAVFTTYLFLVCFLFFAWFWIHGGQTLGMRAWRLRVQQAGGAPVTWWHALLRFISGLPAWALLLLGLGQTLLPAGADLPRIVAWLYHAPDGLLLVLGGAWLALDHSRWSPRDRFSETTVVLLPKEQA